MDQTGNYDIEAEIRKGMVLTEGGELDAASALFDGLCAQGGEGIPVVQSFAGMLKAVRERHLFLGLEMCKQALSYDDDDPVCYANLARVYLAMNDRQRAVKALQKGLKKRKEGRDYLIRYYRQIGVRRAPVLRFLSRSNPLNIILGRLTYRKGSLKAARY